MHRISNTSVIAVGMMGTAVFAYWRAISTHEGSMSVWQLFISSGIVFLATVFLWWKSYQANKDVSLIVVVLFAVLFRMLGIGAEPILEDDVYRFLWDGKQTVEAGSPYLSAPDEHFDDEALGDRWHDILGSINHPSISTVYGPTAQWSFALAYLIGPGKIWALQLIYAFSDLALILLLSRLTASRNLMLYAWSPLVIKEFSFSAHPDVVGALLMVLGFIFLRKKHAIAAGVALALAVGVKIFAFIAVPLLLVFNWRAWTAFIIAAILVAIPFGGTSAWFPEGLAAMSGDWTFNAPIYLSVINSLPLIYVKALMIIILGFVCLALFWQEINAQSRCSTGTVERVSYAFGALYICSPVMNPWYLIWLLVFATVRPSAWAWVASISVMLAYVSGINLSNSSLALYQQPLWLVWAEFLSVLAAFWLFERRPVKDVP